MIEEGQIIGEADFQIIDEEELKEFKMQNSELNKNEGGNLRDDLIKLGLLDYDKLSEDEQKAFDEMKNEKRDDNFYEL